MHEVILKCSSGPVVSQSIWFLGGGRVKGLISFEIESATGPRSTPHFIAVRGETP